MDKALKIISLEAENVKRLKAVRIIPDGNVIVIGGENEQGKTSVFDCIRMALGGSKETPFVPIRRGANSATITLDLGELVAELSMDSTGRKIVVRNADGKSQAKPQAILDALYNKVAFDPLAFSMRKPEEQKNILRQLVGLDFAEENQKRAELYEKRTIVGRIKNEAEVNISKFPKECLDAPDTEVSVSELLLQKEEADQQNLSYHKLDDYLKELTREETRLSVAVIQAQEALEVAMKKAELAKEKTKETRRELQQKKEVDTSEIIAAIKGADAVNRLVRAKKERAATVANYTAADREYTSLTSQIKAIDDLKADKMEKAPWPIPGLGFSDTGVTINGLPFEQSSKSERMKVSLAIGAALNPKLRVLLMEDASLLDSESMKMIYEIAKEKDMQIWVERVGKGDAGAIIIEDGEVVE